MSFLDRSFTVPTSAFMRQFLAFYNIKILDLGPHIAQYISLFVARCECYLGCPPYFPLWLSIFHGRAAQMSKSDPTVGEVRLGVPIVAVERAGRPPARLRVEPPRYDLWSKWFNYVEVYLVT
jgi:hypothetical protein